MAKKNTPGMIGSTVSKADRRAAAREQARKLQEQEAAKAKRNKIIIGAVVAALLLLVGFAIYSIVTQEDESQVAQLVPAAEASEGDTNIRPANVDQEDGALVVGPEGLGSTSDGVPVVDIYADFLCVYCSQLEADFGEQLAEAAANGEITLRHHVVTLVRTGEQDFNVMGARALAYVADHSPEHAVDFHNALFDVSEEIFAQTRTTMPDWAEIQEIARSLGVPEDVVAELPNGQFTEFVRAATADFRGAGYTGTPTVLVDGENKENWREGLTEVLQ